MISAKERAGYGNGVVQLDYEYLDASDVKERLDATFHSADYRPPSLPKVAMEVLELSRRPEITYAQVGAVLERDAMLAGQVLKIAQSPMYAGRVPVTSISQALARLGISTVRDLVFQVSMNSRVFRAKAYQPVMEALQAHGTAVAHLSRVVARYTSVDAEFAFMCGLLHDVGLAGGLVALTEGRKDPPELDVAWPAVSDYHNEAGQRMVTLWGLPMDVMLVAQSHHLVKCDGYPHPMSAVVRIADAIAEQSGFGMLGNVQVASTASREMPLAEAMSVLSLGAKQIEALTKDANAAVESLRGG